MQIKVLTLSFNQKDAKFDDTELMLFLRDKEVFSARDYFFTKNENHYLLLILRYSSFFIRGDEGESKEESWKDNLAETDMGLFNLLRDWRAKRCQKDGVPPYVVFTNRQLVQIVKTRPQTLADLSQIEGVGRAKIQKYGEEVLKITQTQLDATAHE